MARQTATETSSTKREEEGAVVLLSFVCIDYIPFIYAVPMTRQQLQQYHREWLFVVPD